MNDMLFDTAVDVARAGQPPVRLLAGRIIAEFDNPQDAKLFAGIKREQGDQVTITPGVYHLLAVRLLVPVIP